MGLLHSIDPTRDPVALDIFLKLVDPIIEGSRGRVTIDGMMADFASGKSACWAVARDGLVSSVGVTSIRNYPSGRRVMILLYAGGTMEDAVGVMPEVEAMARNMDCDAMQIQGRKGWQKVFTDGWEEVYRTLEKEL
jgi:hypothetical protein